MTIAVPDPVVDELDAYQFGKITLLDVRDTTSFSSARLQGAVRVPIEAWEAAARTSETGLHNAAYWLDQIGALGVNGHKPVFVYDDGRLTEAARVWFILQHFGVPAKLVNGGWSVLAESHRQWIENGAPRAVATAQLTVRGSVGPVGLLDREEIRAALNGSTRILDARTADEYAGTDLRKNARGGHLPGAKHLAHSDLISDGRLRPAHELRKLFEAAGFNPGDRVATHCDAGGRAALAAIAAVRAGYANTDVYYLSFSDWAKDDSCPVVT